MTFTKKLCLISALCAWLPVASAQEAAAPPVSDDSAVWSVIERAWQAERQGDTKWVDELLSADFVGWSNDTPAPRDKGSTRMWNNFASKQVDVVEYELYPLSIVVHGDMAVAHYLYSTATKPKGEPVEMSHGRYTDVLVRVDGGWKFISWHGGDDASD